MNRTVHITSTHYGNPFWIDIQIESIKKHLKVPYKTYMVHANMPKDIKDYTDEFDFLVSDPRSKFHNVDSHQLALPIIQKELQPNDIVIKIDSDAFFINDIDEAFLDRVDREKFIALKEPRHESNLEHDTAHPVFYAFKGEYLEEKGGLMNAMCTIQVDGASNWWGGVDNWLRKTIGKWGVIERTNVTNLHPLYFGIYGDLIYHNWAGSRIMRTREDRRRAKNEGISLDEVIRQNHKLNESVLKSLDTDVDEFIKVLKTK